LFKFSIVFCNTNILRVDAEVTRGVPKCSDQSSGGSQKNVVNYEDVWL